MSHQMREDAATRLAGQPQDGVQLFGKGWGAPPRQPEAHGVQFQLPGTPNS